MGVPGRCGQEEHITVKDDVRFCHAKIRVANSIHLEFAQIRVDMELYLRSLRVIVVERRSGYRNMIRVDSDGYTHGAQYE